MLLIFFKISLLLVVAEKKNCATGRTKNPINKLFKQKKKKKREEKVTQ